MGLIAKAVFSPGKCPPTTPAVLHMTSCPLEKHKMVANQHTFTTCGLLVLHSRFSFCMQIFLISLKLQQTAVANQLCNNIHQVIITVILLRRRSELNWHPARLHGYCRWMWTVGVHSWWIVSFCHLTTTLSFKVQNWGSHHCCHLKSLWSGMCSAHTHWCPESAVL